MDNLNTSKLENQLIQSIKLLHQETLIIQHERLHLLAKNLADSIMKNEGSLDSKEKRGDLLPDALRYEEISFVLPLKEPINNENISGSLISYVKDKFMDIISSGVNSIGTAIRVLPSNEILTVILVAYFKTNQIQDHPTNSEPKQRPGKKWQSSAWKNFSQSQNSRQVPQINNNNNNFNKNRGGNSNFKRKQYSPRQQQPQQQSQLNNGKNVPWDAASKSLTQMQQQPRNQQQMQNTYATWKTQNQQQLPEQNSPQALQQDVSEVVYSNTDEQQLQQKQRNTVWSQFQLNDYYDDKNAYRNVPADMKRSHTRNSEQQKPQGRKAPKLGQRQQQNNNVNNQQHPKPEREVIQEIPSANEIPEQPEVVGSNTEQQEAQPKIEDSHSQWNVIKNILETPFDDKNEYHKLAPELRHTHANKSEQDKQRSPRRDKPQSKLSTGQQQQQKPKQQQQVQQPPQQIPNESEKESTTSRVQSVWSSFIKDDTPYDDRHDVRRLPVQLRRSHHELELEDKKKKQNRANQEKKEQSKQAKNQKQPRRKEQQQQQQQQQQAPEVQPISKVPNAWSNLKFETPVEKTPKQKSPRAKISNSDSIESSQEQQQKQQEQQETQQFHQIEVNNQPEEQNQVPEQENDQIEPEVAPKQEEQKPIAPPKKTPWSSITAESLTAPKKQPQKQQQPQVQVQTQAQVTEPQNQQQEQKPEEVPVAPEAEQQQQQEEQQQEELEETPEEEVVEVKSLAPSERTVQAWSVVGSTKKYDDSKDYRKTPAELRRSHVPASVEQNKQKKNQRKQAANQRENPRNKPQQQQQQQQQPEQTQDTQEPIQNNEQEEVQQEQQPEEQQQEEQQQEQQEQEEQQQAQVNKKPSWAYLPEVPYDDKYDIRKLPPELRRSHVPATIDKSKKEKKDKEKDWNSEKKKERVNERKSPRNPLIQRPVQPEEEKQEKEVSEPEQPAKQEEQQAPIPVKNSVWSSASLDTPYDDKKDLSKIPPQFRRSHKLNEEKAKEAKEAKKQKERDQQQSNRKRNNNKNNQQNETDNNKQEVEQQQQPPRKNLSPWASFNITPVEKPQRPPQQQQQQKQEELVEQEDEQQEIEVQQEQEEQQTEPVQENITEPELTVEDEPAPLLIKKEVHSAWKSINFKSKP